jgi:hypothetical protein
LADVQSFVAKRDAALKQAAEHDLKAAEADQARARASKLTRTLGESLSDTRTAALHVAAFCDNVEVFGFLADKVMGLWVDSFVVSLLLFLKVIILILAICIVFFVLVVVVVLGFFYCLAVRLLLTMALF